MSDSLQPCGLYPMVFSRQEFLSGLPFPSPGDLPDPRIKPLSLTSPALAGGFFTTSPSGKPNKIYDVVTQPCPTLWPHGLYIAYQAPLSVKFSRQQYWSGLPFPSPVRYIELYKLKLWNNYPILIFPQKWWI